MIETTTSFVRVLCIMYYTENKNLENIIYTNDLGIECIEEWRDIPNYVGYYQASDLGRIKSVDRICKKRGRKSSDAFIKGKILSLSRDRKTDYYSLTLYRDGLKQYIRVHELIAITFLGHKKGGYKIVVDHRDTKEKWNNAVWNLQIITQRQNTSKDTIGSSKYVGVCYRPTHKTPYEAKIRINGKRVFLGCFDNEMSAKNIYDKAVEKKDLFTGDIKHFKEIIGVEKKGAKMSERAVILIRRFHKIYPNFSRVGLAKKIGVHEATITSIVNNKSWILS